MTVSGCSTLSPVDHRFGYLRGQPDYSGFLPQFSACLCVREKAYLLPRLCFLRVPVCVDTPHPIIL